MIMLNRTFRKNGFMLSETKNKFILSGKNSWEVLYFSGMILLCNSNFLCHNKVIQNGSLYCKL